MSKRILNLSADERAILQLLVAAPARWRECRGVLEAAFGADRSVMAGYRSSGSRASRALQRLGEGHLVVVSPADHVWDDDSCWSITNAGRHMLDAKTTQKPRAR